MSNVRSNIEAIIYRAMNDGEGEILAEDINDTLTLMGFHSKESRIRMTAKVSAVLDSIVEAKNAINAFKSNPRQAFYNYVGNGKYYGVSTAEHFEDEFANRVNNDLNYLCGWAKVNKK